MPRRRFYVGPDWPAQLSDYEYLRVVGDADCIRPARAALRVMAASD
jgi:hypothetical protein